MADLDHMSNGLRILAADEDESALRELSRMLEGLGHRVTASAVELAQATEAIAREDPDLAVVIVHEDDEHALELIEEINAFARGPVIAVQARDDADFVKAAAERGIAAYARDASPEAVQGAIEVAIRRHAERSRLAAQVDRLETALERRATIERAKGILMERHDIDERAAFERLRSHARARSTPIVEVCRAVADGRALLPGAAAPAESAD